MMLGLAIGDALGITTEGILPRRRRERYGEIRDYLPNRYVSLPIGFPSDDSQLAFWTLEQMITDGCFDPESVARRFCRGDRIFGIGATVSEFIHGADAPGGFVTASKTPLEEVSRDFFASQGISFQRQFVLKVGVSSLKESHRFDLGSDEQKVLIECKDHTFTGSGNVPSAKLTIWNEPMYYFHISPVDCRKVFFVGSHDRGGETLAEY